MKKDFIMLGFWFLALLMIILYARFAYGEITGYPIGPLGYNHWFVDMKGKGPSYDEHQKLVNPPHQVAVVSKEIKQLQKVTSKESLQVEKPFDPVKFSKAVAKHETASGTKLILKRI